MSSLTPRLTAARRQIAGLRIDLATARMQRNVYRDHARRLAFALSAVNDAHATTPPSLHGGRLQQALNEATALATMALAYDDTQTAADPTIQENGS